MRQITAAEVEASNEAADNAPTLYALALAAVGQKAAKHPNPDDLAADAMSLAALFLPEPFRTGERQPADAEEAKRLAHGAARRAVARVLARRYEDEQKATSLDALADALGAEAVAVEVARGTERHGMPAPATPRPDAAWTERPTRHAVPAALSLVEDPAARAALAQAVADYLADAAEPRQPGQKRPTLESVTAYRNALPTDGGEARKIRAQVRAALAEVAPWHAEILAAPTHRTTARIPAAPTATEKKLHPIEAAERIATTGPGEVPPALAAAWREHNEHPKRLARWEATEDKTTHGKAARLPFPWTEPERPAQALPTAAETTRRTIPGRLAEYAVTVGTEAPEAQQARRLAAALDQQAHAAYGAHWTPEPRQARRPWTPEAKATEAAQRLTETAAKILANVRHGARLIERGKHAGTFRAAPAAKPLASATVHRLPEGWGYPAEVASTYALPACTRVLVEVEGRQVEAARLPGHPEAAALLRHLVPSTPAALPLVARLASPDAVGVLARQAPNAHGQVSSQKPTPPRKAARTGQTGPSVPVRLTAPQEVDDAAAQAARAAARALLDQARQAAPTPVGTSAAVLAWPDRHATA